MRFEVYWEEADMLAADQEGMQVAGVNRSLIAGLPLFAGLAADALDDCCARRRPCAIPSAGMCLPRMKRRIPFFFCCTAICAS